MNQTAQVGKALLALMLLTGCSTLPLVEVPSENQNSRVNHLVIHFTSEAFDPSLKALTQTCLLYTSPSPRDVEESRMPSSA